MSDSTENKVTSVDRFDLEQQIMQAWNVVDDLRMLVERNSLTASDVSAVARIYEIKFERLFDTFEQCVSTRKV